MSGLRDYEEWHRQYDDPASHLPWRLRTVQSQIRRALDDHPGPMSILSLCSGDARDILGVLAERPGDDRFSVVLVELHPGLAERAIRTAAAAEIAGVEVRVADAGITDNYAGAAPADLVLLVGIFGNLTDDDVARTIAMAPALCRPGATLIWTRARDIGDINDEIRSGFTAAGFVELDYATVDIGSKPSVGVVRYDGPPTPVQPGVRVFTFVQ